MSTSPTPRDYAPIHLWHPTINDTPITTIPHLHTILNTEYPGLHRNPHYPQLLHDAETHLRLIHHLKDQTHLQHGDRKRIGHELGLTRQKFTAWAQDARTPRLYYELDRMLSKTQAKKRISQLHKENNGIFSTDDVIARLKTYYPAQELTTSPHHHKRLTHCTQYFHALNLLKDGGAYLDVARTLKVRHSQIMRWLDGQRPDYIELTRHIPKQPPEPNHQWLPLTMEANFHPTNFIYVPTTIETWTQIQQVIHQTQPLDTPQMHQWQHQFGPITQDQAFAYLLGIIISDCGKSSITHSSHRIDLRLSKKYSWSNQMGEATCYYLGQIGIHAKQVGNRDSSAGPKTCYSWNSENTPLLQWIDKTCLGLETDQRTTYHLIKANWLLTAPTNIRIKFLQGLNDGDGWASLKDQVLGNACQPNIKFVRNLLGTFKIQSFDDGLRIKILQQDSIIRAVELPFFLQAMGRQEEANALADMMRARKTKKRKLISKELSQEMVHLRTLGHSYGEIALIIFERHGIAYDKRNLSKHIRKQISKQTES